MKNIAIAFIALCATSNCFAQELTAKTASNPSAAADFQWTTTTYDFGKTKVGVPVSYNFGFKNTGMTPLIISSVKASCGCTVTAYTKEPVEHGSTGFVKATYDAAKVGVYTKTVTVSANTPEGVILLTVKGEIVK